MREEIWTYQREQGQVKVTEYHGEGSRAEVPGELGGMPVTALGIDTFKGHTELTEVILPDTLTTIEDGAFEDCVELVALRIPEGVTSIGGSAFAGCGRLFALNLPEGLTRLGWGILEDSDSLPLIYVPDSLDGDALEADPFTGYAGRVALKDDHPTLCVRDGVIMTRDGKVLVHYPSWREDASYTVPQGVERILRGAFQCSKFMAVRFPDSVKALEDSTIVKCERLTMIRVSEDCDVSDIAVVQCPRVEKRMRRIGSYSAEE